MIIHVMKNTFDAQPDRYNIILYTTSEGMVEIVHKHRPNQTLNDYICNE